MRIPELSSMRVQRYSKSRWAHLPEIGEALAGGEFLRPDVNELAVGHHLQLLVFWLFLNGF